MASKGLQDLKQQVEGAAQDAGENLRSLQGTHWTLAGKSRGSAKPESWQPAQAWREPSLP